MVEGEQADSDSVSRVASWVAVAVGLLTILYSFGLLYFGINMLIRALEGDFTSLPAVIVLTIWVAMLLLGLFVVRWGLRIRRTLRGEHDQTNQGEIKPDAQE